MSPNQTTPDNLRRLPGVDHLLQQPELQALIGAYSHAAVVDAIRSTLDTARQSMREGGALPDESQIVRAVADAVAQTWQPTLAPVINASGVIIHTNLGRAPLSEQALAAVAAVAAGYSNLEYDLAAGARGSRHSHIESLLARLVGAEAGMVVNNNAAAVLLALSAIAKGKDVLVSRGQAVEIGGGFRIPDVMRQSGAKLVDVGTTNRTRLSDYADAIGERTAALLLVHSSNFRVVGFTESVEIAELSALAQQRGLPVLNDLGSGSLLDTSAYGLMHEPTVQESVAAGADLTCFSGDKLLGGPQAGLIVGKAELIAKLKRHPLARAVRIDKMTLAALQATLLHYLRGEAASHVPVWMMIARPLDSIERQAQEWADEIGDWPGVAGASVVAGESTIGGGSLPGETLPTRLVALRLSAATGKGELPDVTRLSAALRRGAPAVIARIERNTLLLDPRTVLPGQERTLIEQMKRGVEGIG
jgi:L-seryl-tRNA(Ser) seleniumtransferase